MKNSYLLWITSALLALPTVGVAQPSSVQQGEITFEQKEREMSYSDHQRVVTEKLESFTHSLSEGASPAAPELTDLDIRYISAAYLFCTIRQGSCPMILQTLFEMDLVGSVRQGQVSCPNLSRLWKNWIDVDMERRAELDISIGLISKYQQFKKEARPKFIKCSETIEQVLEKSPEGTELFAHRYGNDSSQRNVVVKALALFKAIEKRKIDLFGSLGLR